MSDNMLIERELLKQAFSETGSTYTDHGSRGVECVRCSECRAYSDDDGWGSEVEHKAGCRYALKLSAQNKIRAILAENEQKE